MQDWETYYNSKVFQVLSQVAYHSVSIVSQGSLTLSGSDPLICSLILMMRRCILWARSINSLAISTSKHKCGDLWQFSMKKNPRLSQVPWLCDLGHVILSLRASVSSLFKWRQMATLYTTHSCLEYGKTYRNSLPKIKALLCQKLNLRSHYNPDITCSNSSVEYAACF